MTSIWISAPALIPAIAVAAAACAIVVLRWHDVAAVALAIVIVGSLSSVVGIHGGLSLYLAFLGLAVFATVVAVARRRLSVSWSPVVTFFIFFLGTRILSLLVNNRYGMTQAAVEEWKNLVLLMILFVLLLNDHTRSRVVVACVLFVAGLAALSLVQEVIARNGTTFAGLSQAPLPTEVSGLLRRHSGPEGDVNFWARTQVLILPLALSLAVASPKRFRQLSWAAAAVFIVIGVGLTQSRGGMLALAVCLIVWLLLYTRKWHLVAVSVLLTSAMLLSLPAVGGRLSSLGSVAGGPRISSDVSLVDRAAVQKAGAAMFLEHPWFGVGAGEFETVEPEYRRRVAPDLSQVTAPHDVYLEMAAEGGVLGELAWLSFIGAAMFAAVRALVTFRKLDAPGPPGLNFRLSAGVVSGLVGWAVASFFLHLADLPILVVVVALAGALDVRAQRLAAMPGRSFSLTAPAAKQRFRSRRAALAASLVCVILMGSIMDFDLFHDSARTVTQTLMLRPRPQYGAAYAEQVLSRDRTRATFASFAQDGGLQHRAARSVGLDGGRATISVSQPLEGGVFTVSVAADTRAKALRLNGAIVAEVTRFVNSLGTVYVVVPVGGALTESGPDRRAS